MRPSDASVKYYGLMADREDKRRMWVSPDAVLSTMRLYFPGIQVIWITRKGRRVCITAKMARILAICERERKRGRGTTLGAIAKEARVSRSYVSRVLTRFDWWCFFDVVTLRGRSGGVWFAKTWERVRRETSRYARRATRDLMAQVRAIKQARAKWQAMYAPFVPAFVPVQTQLWGWSSLPGKGMQHLTGF